MASPVYTAPLAESSRAKSANVGLFPLIDAQVEIVPSSAAKRNWVGVPRTRKSWAVGLNTTPVGLDGGVFPEGSGMPTTSGIAGAPEGANTFAVPRTLSATEKGCPGSNERPHGLSRPGSVWSALPATSATRPVCWNPLPVADGAGTCMREALQARKAPTKHRQPQSTAILLTTGIAS